MCSSVYSTTSGYSISKEVKRKKSKGLLTDTSICITKSVITFTRAATLVCVLLGTERGSALQVVAAVGIQSVCHLIFIAVDCATVAGVEGLTVEAELIPVLVDINVTMLRPVVIAVFPVAICPTTKDQYQEENLCKCSS